MKNKLIVKDNFHTSKNKPIGGISGQYYKIIFFNCLGWVRHLGYRTKIIKGVIL